MAHPSYPKSVREIDGFPYPFARFELGKKLHQIITFCQEVHASLATSGAVQTLVNELRTLLHTGGGYKALIDELYTRLHTGGDYQALVAELRTTLHTGGGYKALVDEVYTRLHTGGDYQALVAELRTLFHTGGGYKALIDELYTRLHTGGDYQALVAELRTTLHTGGGYKALIDELYTRLHTGGDYQLAVAEVVARLTTAGDVLESLADVADKAYNQILSDPAWQEDAGVATDIENAGAIDAIVNGLYYAGLVAANTNYSPIAAWNTGAAEQKTVTLQVDAGGTVTSLASAAVAFPGAAAQAPRPTAGQCPVGVAIVPENFTAGVTQIVAGGVTLTDGFPRRSLAPVTVAAAAPAAIVAGVQTIAAAAPAAITATPQTITAAAPAAITATPQTITASALADPSFDTPDSLPDSF